MKNSTDSVAGSDERRRRLRRERIDARLALAPATVAAGSAAICRHLIERFEEPPGRQIAFFWPIRQEPDVRDAIAHWSLAGAAASLPVVGEPGSALAFRAWNPRTPMLADRHGIPSPASGSAVIPDVLLIPLNAYDDAGYRIGYGGGYYDRTLAALRPRPLAIGVAFALARVASTEPQPHDQRLDWIVTETGIFRTHAD